MYYTQYDKRQVRHRRHLPFVVLLCLLREIASAGSEARRKRYELPTAVGRRRDSSLRAYVAGSFPDGNSALMLVCARLRYVAGTQWDTKKCLNMKCLKNAVAFIAG